MPANRIMPLIILAVALIGIALSAFTVTEREKAILFQFGKIVRSDFEPGLHWKVPFINNVVKFDRRLLTHDANPERILTGEKKNVLVDYYVKWRIDNVEQFYLTFRGIESNAASQIGDIIKDSLQNELNERTIKEVVSDDRDTIMDNLAKNANEKLNKFGIEVADVRIKQIELEDEVKHSVFSRMRAERERVAREHRALGDKEARIIRAAADREVTELKADARRRAETIRGEGDGMATQIYAEAYSKDEEFYSFYRSMQSYRETFKSKDDVIVLEPDSEFFKYFGSSKGR
jgi:membrane protease subunit HflC